MSRGRAGRGPGVPVRAVRRGTVTGCQIIGPDEPPGATYVLGMEYADWKALYEGYDAQRTVIYRKMMLEDGDLLQFFTAI